MKKNFDKKLNLRFVCQFSLLKTKLKFKKFTHAHFVINFVFQKCISNFIFIFINDFEFYRNNYRILMKIYIIVTIFTFKKGIRKINVFFLRFNFMIIIFLT